MFSKISKIKFKFVVSAWPRKNIMKGSGSNAEGYRYSRASSSTKSSDVSSTIKNGTISSTTAYTDNVTTRTADATVHNTKTTADAQISYYDNNKSKSFKKIFWGWIGLIVLSNISFYLVKNEIDSRRKANYLGMLGNEQSKSNTNGELE